MFTMEAKNGLTGKKAEIGDIDIPEQINIIEGVKTRRLWTIYTSRVQYPPLKEYK